jgi:hypothetical protein
MKTFATLLAAGAIAFAPKPAAAHGNEGIAALGGFVGGVIVGANLNHHRPVVACPPAYAPPPRVIVAPYPPPRVVVAPCPPPRVVVAPCPPPPPPPPMGYWREVTVRDWVPGYWTTVQHHGRHERRYVPGHFEYRTERIWVDARRGDSHAYGYGR